MMMSNFGKHSYKEINFGIFCYNEHFVIPKNNEIKESMYGRI